MRKFEKVLACKDLDYNLPKRKTKYSAGYDFECIETVTIPPYKAGDKPFMVRTGVKCYMGNNEYLMLVSRSSNPKKKNLVIPNSLGIIDADFYDNPENEGEISFCFFNVGTEPVVLEKGYCMGQGIFMEYKITDDDDADGERSGGFGSTNKEE